MTTAVSIKRVSVEHHHDGFGSNQQSRRTNGSPNRNRKVIPFARNFGAFFRAATLLLKPRTPWDRLLPLRRSTILHVTSNIYFHMRTRIKPSSGTSA